MGFLESKHVEATLKVAHDIYEITLIEEPDDPLSDEIEAFHDEMMDLNQRLLEEDAADYQAAGVVVNLKDGRSVYADVPTHLLVRILECLKPEEFAEVVSAIADTVENPDQRTFCQRMRDEK